MASKLTQSGENAPCGRVTCLIANLNPLTAATSRKLASRHAAATPICRVRHTLIGLRIEIDFSSSCCGAHRCADLRQLLLQGYRPQRTPRLAFRSPETVPGEGSAPCSPTAKNRRCLQAEPFDVHLAASTPLRFVRQAIVHREARLSGLIPCSIRTGGLLRGTAKRPRAARP